MSTESAAEFDRFYLARFPSLCRSIFLACGDWSKAEDATQEAFIRAWQRWRTMENDDPVAWVRTVAWRICLDDMRSRRRLVRALHRLRDEHAEPTHNAALSEVLELFEPLSPSLRPVAVLHYADDLSIQQISELLEIPEGTVKSRLSRARDVLRSTDQSAAKE